MKINENLTKVNFTDHNKTSRIKWIVIHYTANNGDTAWGNTNYFKSAYRGASAHYFVDEKEIWRCVTDADIAWHCGASKYYNDARNTNSIGIEMCSRKKDGEYYFMDETVQNTVELVKYLMKKYKVPASRVVRHYDVTRKKCPEPYMDSKAWKAFKAMLTEEPAPTIKEGCHVKVNSGAKSYDGKKISAWVYNGKFKVDEVKGDRVLLDRKGICTPFKASDLTIV